MIVNEPLLGPAFFLELSLYIQRVLSGFSRVEVVVASLIVLFDHLRHSTCKDNLDNNVIIAVVDEFFVTFA